MRRWRTLPRGGAKCRGERQRSRKLLPEAFSARSPDWLRLAFIILPCRSVCTESRPPSLLRGSFLTLTGLSSRVRSGFTLPVTKAYVPNMTPTLMTAEELLHTATSMDRDLPCRERLLG